MQRRYFIILTDFMKKTIIIASIALITAHCVQAQTYTTRVLDASRLPKQQVNWKNKDDVATYDADVARHKHHDVVVHKRGSSYMVTYYQLENDTIRPHGFGPASDNVYDKAEYQWIKDTLDIKLYSTTTQKSSRYKGFGWGPTSSVIDMNE